MPSLKALAKEAKGKKAPKARKAVAEKAAPPKKILSSERVEESDDEDEESSEEESSENESIPENPADAKLPAPDGSSSSSENDSESDEGSSEEEGTRESSEDEPDKPVEKAPRVSKPAEESAKEPASKVIAPKRPAAYKPPPRFDPASIKDTAEAGSKFKKSKLEGKQIWYFTAPASVRLSEIKGMSLLGAKSGEVVYSHQGSDYGFVQDTSEDSTNARIMVLSSNAEYKSVSKPVDKAFRLQQVVNIPGVNDSGNSSNSHATVPQKKPVRPQPKGLKMRYAPIGFGDGKIGTIGSESSSDEEMEEAPAQFQRPVPISSDESENSGDSDGGMANAPPLPSKKTSKPAKETINSSSSMSLKRKHGDGSEKATKHSSFYSTTTDEGKKLKRQKTKETESQKGMVDRLSGSTKAPVSTTPIPPPKALTSKPESAIKPSKHHESSSKSKSKDNSTTSGKKSKKDKPFKELSQEADVVADEERRKKAKKSRKEGLSHSRKEKGK